MFKRPSKEHHHIDRTGPKEIVWFIALWVLGVAGVGVLAVVIRLVLGAW
ncbi:MAG: hypothetical protein OXI79_20230 [Gammaproteobacteria bacterium]|nr:hypothetical protein [Gammaproteobacteria bacterium]